MWNLKIIDTDKTLYIAIADALERDIRLGELKAGDKMPTHRALAKTVGVNVTTITRAYKEAEKRGLITSTVGRGTFITSDSGVNSSLRNTDKNGIGLIEMGLVLPLYSAEPDISPIIKKVLHRNDLKQYMAYTPPEGLYKHRQAGSEWMKRFGINANAENIIITAGAQHALNCIFSSLFQQGDHIAVDCLTYPGVKTAAKRYGIHLEGIPTDDEGMLPNELKAACTRNEIKGIYTVSTIQNPTNIVMSEQRKLALAKIIENNNLILVEDDMYGFLSSQSAIPLTQHVPEHGIYIAGISKAFYAGLRISFTVVPRRFYNRISQAVVDTMWMAPALNAEIVYECIVSKAAEEIIEQKRVEIRQRAQLMKESLAGYDLRYTPDSMFAWLKLPDYWSSSRFDKAASENGVNIISSDKFIVGSVVPPNYIRLSLTGTDTLLEFKQGLCIIMKLLNREIGTTEGVL